MSKTFRITDPKGSIYTEPPRVQVRVQEIEGAAREACLSKTGRMVGKHREGRDNRKFLYPEDMRSFFCSLAGLLYEYEEAMRPEATLREVHEANEAAIGKVERHLYGFGFSRDVIDRTLEILREDQEKSLERAMSSEDVNEVFWFKPGKHAAKAGRDKMLLKIRDLYVYLSPFKSNRQIAFNLSLALARLGLKPDKADAIEKVFVNANKALSETPAIDEQS